MTGYIDALLHIADLATLIGWLNENAPERLNASRTEITGFAGTPLVHHEGAAMTYVRMKEHDADFFRDTAPDVTVLAEAPFNGNTAETVDLVYTRLDADPAMRALYDAVYDQSPRMVPDGQGGQITYTPPERLGHMG